MIKVLKGQSLFDIAVQETGSVENVFELAFANDLSITDILQAGTEIIIPDTIEKDKNVYGYYNRLELKPATDIGAQKGGIGYMGIQIDFIIS